MRNVNSFDLYKNIDQLANEGKKLEVIELLEKELPYLTKKDAKKHLCFFMDVLANFYLNCGRIEDARKITSVMIRKGYGCKPQLVHQLFTIDPIHIKKLKNKNDTLLKLGREKSSFDYQVILPKGYSTNKKYPLFIGIHQGGDNMDILNWYFKPDAFLERDFIFVYVQSSQYMRHGRYEWLKNIEIARKDIKQCYDIVTQLYSIDFNKVLIGGFSCGGVLAIDIVIKELFPIKGYISVSPDDVLDSFTRENSLKINNIKGAIIDSSINKGNKALQDLITLFNESHVKFYFVNEVIYYHPEELTNKFKEALAFIMN